MEDGTLCPQGHQTCVKYWNQQQSDRFVSHQEFQIPAMFANAHFRDALTVDRAHPERSWQPKAAASLLEWIKAPREARPLNVVIKGASSGTGKTHIAAAAVNELRSMGQTSVILSLRNLLGMVHRAQFRKEESFSRLSEEDIVEVLHGVDVLGLDDYRTEAISQYQQGIIWELVDCRYRAMKPTLITTNFECEALLQNHEWKTIGRRLFDSCLVIDVDKERERAAQMPIPFEGTPREQERAALMQEQRVLSAPESTKRPPDGESIVRG